MHLSENKTRVAVSTRTPSILRMPVCGLVFMQYLLDERGNVGLGYIKKNLMAFFPCNFPHE